MIAAYNENTGLICLKQGRQLSTFTVLEAVEFEVKLINELWSAKDNITARSYEILLEGLAFAIDYVPDSVLGRALDVVEIE